MKDFIKIFLIGLLIGIIYLLLCLCGYNYAYKRIQKKELPVTTQSNSHEFL